MIENLLKPWAMVTNHAANLEAELRRELAPGHSLAGRTATAIARRTNSDDVLFRLDGPGSPYAVVHLTWRGEPEVDPRWPLAIHFDSIDRWRVECMEPDHREFLEENEDAEEDVSIPAARD